MGSIASHAATALVSIVLAVGLPGCGGGSGSDAATPAAAPTISSDGGSVSGSAGVTVVVPPGALQQPATIRVAADSTGAPPVPPWFRAAGPMVAITPHGATFSEPVTVRLPAPSVTLAANERLLIAKAQPGGEWEVFMDTRLADGQLEVQVDSFSVFVPVVVPFTTGTTTGLNQPFAMSPITLECDGVPCANPERLRPISVTATTSANGGYLPANCVNPQLTMRYSNGDESVSSEIGTAVPATSATVLRRSFALPTSFPSLYSYESGLYVRLRMTCTDPATNARSTLRLTQIKLTTDSARLPAGTPVVRQFPGALTQAVGDSPVLRAVFQRGASGASSSTIPDYTAPTSSDGAEIYFERLSSGDTAWRIVQSRLQTEADPRPYNGRAWHYWAFDFPIGPLTPADNGAAFRVRACYQAPGAATMACAIGPTATLTVVQQAQPPSFTTQPRSMLILPGQTASFTTQVGGTPAPTLQWQRRGNATGSEWVDVPGSGNAASYTTPPIAAADNGVQFRLLATNSAGSVASEIATVSVNATTVPPAITAQPMSISVVRGSEAVFAVNATGTEALSYQWFKGGAVISGANAPQLKIANAGDGEAGSYSVQVSNAAGSATSNTAMLAVTTVAPTVVAPGIVTQPAAVAVTEGNVATFAVGAVGSGPLGFQWRRNGMDIAGANAAAYTIAAVALADAGNYSVRVSNGAGSVASQVATLAVAPAAGGSPVVQPPTIVVNQDSIVVAPGMDAMFGVQASGSGPLTYRWLRNGVPVPDQDSAIYVVNGASALDAGSYQVEVSNSAGTVTSATSRLLLLGAPAITSQPASVSIQDGGATNFNVAASGDALRYQWLRNGVAIPGATDTTYSTPLLGLADSGAVYSVAVYNGAGLVFSQAAVLSVTPTVLSSDPAAKLALGSAHACAVMADYTVACWGINNQGQLGNGGTVNARAPTAVSGLTGVIAVAVGSRGFYSSYWSQSCAVQATGALWCWGRDANFVDQLVPQAVAGVSDARAVAVGSGHACYLDAAGRVHCWGFNVHGELGNGSFGNPQPAPALVQRNGATLTGIVAIGAGDIWTCALGSDGSVWCWGVDHTGNAEFNPLPVAGVGGATQLAVGAGHACAVVAGGAVRCWGYGGNGQLGNGGTATSVASVAVSGLTEVTALALGATHTCARRSGGEVVCWGSANLGNGSSSSTAPGAAVTGLDGVSALAAGAGSTCVLRSDGQVLCWGSNFYGQLGVGDTSDRAAPTATAAGASFWHP